MKMTIDFRSEQPIYIQIVEQIRALVGNGELQQGDQLPTVRQLAAELRVNFNTVARAYRLLDKSGLISTQQGRGTFIWEQPSGETLQRLREEELESLTDRYLGELKRLGFTPKEALLAAIDQIELWEKGELPLKPPDETDENS